ncbi:YCF48-related protein [Pseudomonas sp. UMAB-40]|uniref:WD40/YVTN/BNR-like repeat-containing protein n=1 Tax=Pseudomonas sp. UMAB-40 TaxID=1365407 RepID=UPI001C57588B|nr:YCF48-related protein [Pseudomonas sp. UMAB-40]
MTMIKWFLLAALSAALAVPFTRPVIAGEFAGVLDTPALHSDLAAQSTLTGLTLVGERLVAVGQRGHILYSDDAGQHWQQAQVPVSSDLVAVHFPSPSQGWAVGHDGVVLHSVDAGQTWSRQLDGAQVGPILLDYYQHQLASQPDNADLQARVSEAQRMVEEGADKPFLDVWFESEQVGYIVGAFNLIFRTDDGGRRWTPLLEHTDNPSALNLYALRPVGADLFVVGEQGLVMKLDRASGRFNATPTPYNGSFFGITGKPGATLVFGLRGNVFRSTDSGASWSKIDLGLPLSITASSVNADGRIVLVSQAGHVLVSVDDGASFQSKPNTSLAPVAAAQVATGGTLVLAGTRGLRQLPLE